MCVYTHTLIGQVLGQCTVHSKNRPSVRVGCDEEASGNSTSATGHGEGRQGEGYPLLGAAAIVSASPKPQDQRQHKSMGSISRPLVLQGLDTDCVPSSPKVLLQALPAVDLVLNNVPMEACGAQSF